MLYKTDLVLHNKRVKLKNVNTWEFSEDCLDKNVSTTSILILLKNCSKCPQL